MQHEKRIILVTENNLQAHSFSATLAELLQRPIQNVAHPNELLPEITRDQLFLVDLDYLRNQTANGWHAALTCNKQAPDANCKATYLITSASACNCRYFIVQLACSVKM